MTFARSQKGLSVLSWLVVLAFVAFVASTAMKMVPHYLDFMSMEKIIKSAETDRAAQLVTVADFYSHVQRGMDVNNIRDMDAHKILVVTEEGDQFLVHLDYENRESMIGNLDLVAHFDRQYSVRKP